MNENTKICARLDEIRKRLGLSQEQLASELGTSQPAVSKYLRDRIPPADVLLKMARLGQTTVEWILTGDKTYLYEAAQSSAVREPQNGYDTDMQLARDIAQLPAEIRTALIILIRTLNQHSA